MPRNPGRPSGYTPRSQPTRQRAGFSGIQGEKDAEIGRRLEQGLPADPLRRQQVIGTQQKQAQNWKLKLKQMDDKDQKQAKSEIVNISKFLKEVASEEQTRQQEMRKRVKGIEEEKLGSDTKKEKRKQIMDDLVEPTSKPKRGSFMAKMMKKGKGALSEAKGALSKGGG